MSLTRVVTLRKKGQLTIPDDIRAALGLEEGQPLWLIQRQSGILLTTHAPGQGSRIGETAASYDLVSTPALEARSPEAGKRSTEPTLGEVAAMLASGPHLTTEEADAFARDLADIVAQTNDVDEADPWAS